MPRQSFQKLHCVITVIMKRPMAWDRFTWYLLLILLPSMSHTKSVWKRCVSRKKLCNCLSCNFGFFSSFSSSILDGLAKTICSFFFYFTFPFILRAWAVLDLSTWYAVGFKPCPFETNIMENLSVTMWNLNLQPLEHYISTTTVCMTITLGRMVTYLEWFLSIKLHGS